MTGLGGGFDISLPGAANPNHHARKANRTPRQPALPAPQRFFFVWFTAVRLQGPAPTLGSGTSGRRQSSSAQSPPRPRPLELSRARGGADEEVAAASPSANWFPVWQLQRGGSAGGSAGGAHGDGTRSRNATGSRQGRPRRARPRRERGRPLQGRARARSLELHPAQRGLEPSAAHRLGRPDLATSTWASCGQEGARGRGYGLLG